MPLSQCKYSHTVGAGQAHCGPIACQEAVLQIYDSLPYDVISAEQVIVLDANVKVLVQG